MVFSINYQYQLPASEPFFIFIEYQNQDNTLKVQYGDGEGYEHLFHRSLCVLVSPLNFTPRAAHCVWQLTSKFVQLMTLAFSTPFFAP